MITESLRDDPLHNEFLTRLKQGRDLRVIITGENAATGVGKTTAAACLARMWDVHGWDASKGTLDPKEFSVKYHEVPPGSFLILDEAEKGLERRRSMAKKVLEVGHDFASLRYRQVFGAMTLPSRDMMDKRIAEQLCDYWLICSEKPRGKAKVFKFGYNEVIGQAYKEFLGTFSFPPLDSWREYQKLDQKKRDREEGRTQSKYIHRDDLEEMKNNWWNKASEKSSFELIRAVYDQYDISQSDIADAVGVSQPTVSNVVNAESFEDWYSPGSTTLAEV